MDKNKQPLALKSILKVVARVLKVELIDTDQRSFWIVSGGS